MISISKLKINGGKMRLLFGVLMLIGAIVTFIAMITNGYALPLFILMIACIFLGVLLLRGNPNKETSPPSYDED